MLNSIPALKFLNLIKKHHLYLSEYQDEQKQRYFHLDSPLASLWMSAHGAQVLSYKPANHPELLWLSQSSIFNKEKAIRGGVPICWPFFGPYLGQIKALKQAPNHGFARTMTWKLKNFKQHSDSFELLWQLPSAPLIEKLGFKFSLQYKITIGEQLKLELTTKNMSQEAFILGGALHSYFTANVAQLKLLGLPENFVDSIDKCAKTQAKFALSKQTDRIYPWVDSAIELEDSEHRVSIENKGNDSIVVWNPGAKLAATMGDLHPDAHQQYICIESAQSKPTFELKAGQSHSLVQIISPQ